MHDLKRAKLKLGNQYIISFTGLNEGEYTFEFNFEQEFFDEHELLGASRGDLKGIVVLDKKPSMMTLEISINGFLEIRCDRCLDNFDFPLKYQGNLIVKFGRGPAVGDDEIWILTPDEHKLDLEQHFFECIELCLPIQRIHPENTEGTSPCNTEMLNLLNSFSDSTNENSEIDPRWNKLKDFLNDTNNSKNGTSEA